MFRKYRIILLITFGILFISFSVCRALDPSHVTKIKPPGEDKLTEEDSIPASSWCGITRIPFEKDGKWGFMDGQGRAIIKPRFHTVRDFFPSGLAAVVDESGQWVYIDTQGNLVIRPFNLLTGPDYYSEGLARYTKDEKFGFFDRTGKVVIEARFDFAEPFSEGRAAICLGCKETKIGNRSFWEDGKWGYINKRGEIVIPPKFDRAGQFRNGNTSVVLNGKYVFIDTNGNIK